MPVLPSDWFPVDVHPWDLSLTPAGNWEEPFRTFCFFQPSVDTWTSSRDPDL